ncbi:hypothetical protein MPRI_39040 [Mycobacterium paraintracellulare]|uniref:Transcriptional regulator n=1 Tax=Mycobacterium paraintracellulare TaxID=1138383 RepID=A0ABM7KC54_9MYCO|nr:hypothetical protein MPRI_39040 [Mycobacterium paraintracellulare]
MCGIEQLAVPEFADGALLLVRKHDSTPEHGLMQSLSYRALCIFALDRLEMERIGYRSKALIEGNQELPVSGIILNDVCGKHWDIKAGLDFAKQYDRKSEVGRST